MSALYFSVFLSKDHSIAMLNKYRRQQYYCVHQKIPTGFNHKNTS